MSNIPQIERSVEIRDITNNEVIATETRILEPNSSYKIHLNFIKVYTRIESLSINSTLLGHLIKMTEYLEYNTNRLVIKSSGHPNIIMTRQDIADKLEVSNRNFTNIYNRLNVLHLLIRNNGAYYINPSIALMGTMVTFETIRMFYSIDPDLRRFINSNDRHILDLLLSNA